MSTELHQQTARDNGALSKGPATPLGKWKASHPTMGGITGRAPLHALLQAEPDPALIRLRDTLNARLDPQGELEQMVVDQLTGALWRYHRCSAVESAHWQHEIDKSHDAVRKDYADIDEITESALAFSSLEDTRHTFSNIARYETTLSREIDRLWKRLKMLQQSRPAEKAIRIS